MTDVRPSRTIFNIMLIGTALLLLATIILSYLLYQEVATIGKDPVTAVVDAKSLEMPLELRSSLEAKGIVSVAFFTKKQEILSYIIDGGKPVDLCHGYGEGAGLKACKLDIPIAALMEDMVIPDFQTSDSGAPSDSKRSAIDMVISTAAATQHTYCGRCRNSSGSYSPCHMTGTNDDRYADKCHATGYHPWCSGGTVCR